MKVAVATTQPNGFLSLRIAILTQSGEGEFQHPRILTMENTPKWTPSVEKRTKALSFTTEKNDGIHHSHAEWPLWVGKAIETMSFAMQNDSRLHHSAAE